MPRPQAPRGDEKFRTTNRYSSLPGTLALIGKNLPPICDKPQSLPELDKQPLMLYNSTDL